MIRIWDSAFPTPVRQTWTWMGQTDRTGQFVHPTIACMPVWPVQPPKTYPHLLPGYSIGLLFLTCHLPARAHRRAQHSIPTYPGMYTPSGTCVWLPFTACHVCMLVPAHVCAFLSALHTTPYTRSMCACVACRTHIHYLPPPPPHYLPTYICLLTYTLPAAATTDNTAVTHSS